MRRELMLLDDIREEMVLHYDEPGIPYDSIDQWRHEICHRVPRQLFRSHAMAYFLESATQKLKRRGIDVKSD